MNRPLLAITLSFILGIVLNTLVEINIKLVILLTLAVFCAALVGYIMAWRESRQVFVLLFFLLGWFHAGVDTLRPLDGTERFAGHFITLEGTVTRGPEISKDKVSYVLETDNAFIDQQKHTASGLVLVKVAQKDNSLTFGYGDRLRLRGFLYQPNEPGNFGAFNYQAYLERRGIYCLMKVDKPEDVCKVGISGNPIVRLALQSKQKLLGVAGATLDERPAAVLGGMLFGSKGSIDSDIKEIFATTGVAHTLCVSGLHVGYVLAGVLLLTGWLRLPYRAVLFVAAAVLMFYAIMTGMGPAVMRASIMALAALLAWHLNRERDWPTTLSFAALGTLIFDPTYLFEIGFQLSFAATWGILYLSPLLGEWLIKRWVLPRWLGLTLQITIAAQLGTLPLVVYYFNLFTPVAPVANLILVPMVGVIMLVGFLGCIVGTVFLPAALVINTVTGLIINIFLSLAELISYLPGGSTYLATPSWYVVVLWYAGLFLLWEILQGSLTLPGNKIVKKVIPVTIAILLVLLIYCPGNGTGGQLQVHFIDVGQGDSILIRFPSGRTMLVDAGGQLGDLEDGRVVGDAVVVPYLHRLGINKLDVLLITHPHGDHAGGALPVAEKLKVGALVLPYTLACEELLSHMTTFNIPTYRVNTGQALQIDNQVEVMVLAPQKKELFSATDEDFNNESVVLRIQYEEVSFLLTGDIEEEAQRELLAQGMELHTDVLKVPHHGSRFTDPGFFAAVAPQYAVIQVGKNNRFGHPAQATLTDLEKNGAKILRTDLNGAVMFITDGHKLKVDFTAKTPREQQKI